MNSKKIQEFKEKLENNKIALKKELETFATEDKNLKHNWDAKYPNREDGDKDEEADEVQEYNNMLALEHSLESKLRDVDIAIEKINTGEYGKCEKCGKEIEEARLEVAPEAKLCIKCNSKK